jgi:hypothetical protein
MRYRNNILIAAAPIVLLLIAAAYSWTDRQRPPQEDPLQIIRAYLRATLARDYLKAYQFISSADRQVWDERSYAAQNGGVSGFTLELARKLAEEMELWVIDRQSGPHQARYRVGYRVPTGDELSSQLHDWDQNKLNGLSQSEQERLLEQLAHSRSDPRRVTIAGEQTFALVADHGRWSIFHDWASGVNVTFKLALPPSGEIEAQFLASKFIVNRAETFQTNLRIKNLSKRVIVASIVHRFDPQESENKIDMLMCGALQPFTLEPGADREFSTAYLLREEAGPGTPLAVTYEIALERAPAIAARATMAGMAKTPRYAATR